ncbi:MAG: hypothetical protein ABJB47_11720 [Actinomycetota bacterium]
MGLVLGLLSMFGLFSVADLIGQLGDLRRTFLLVGFSLIIGGVAVWLGSTSVARARREVTARPRGATSAMVLGGIGVLLSVLLLVSFTVLSKQFGTYSRCMKGANTLAAQQTCHDQFTRSINAETHRLRSSP